MLGLTRPNHSMKPITRRRRSSSASAVRASTRGDALLAASAASSSTSQRRACSGSRRRNSFREDEEDALSIHDDNVVDALGRSRKKCRLRKSISNTEPSYHSGLAPTTTLSIEQGYGTSTHGSRGALPTSSALGSTTSTSKAFDPPLFASTSTDFNLWPHITSTPINPIGPVSHMDLYDSPSHADTSPFGHDESSHSPLSISTTLSPEPNSFTLSEPYTSTTADSSPPSELEDLHRAAFDSLRKSTVESEIDFTSKFKRWEERSFEAYASSSSSCFLATSPLDHQIDHREGHYDLMAPPCSPERIIESDFEVEDGIDDDEEEGLNVIVASTHPISTPKRASDLPNFAPSSLPTSTCGLTAAAAATRSDFDRRQLEVEELSRRLRSGALELDDYAQVRDWQERHSRRLSTHF